MHKLYALLLPALLAACSGSTDTTDDEFARFLAELGHPRDWAESDLEAAIREADGKVMIGFKNPGEARGVSPEGKILTTPANLAQGIADMQAIGVVVRRVFPGDAPVIAATIERVHIRPILANPRTDYLEPNSRGGWEWIR